MHAGAHTTAYGIGKYIKTYTRKHPPAGAFFVIFFPSEVGSFDLTSASFTSARLLGKSVTHNVDSLPSDLYLSLPSIGQASFNYLS